MKDKIFCLIPARSESKRIKNKNMKKRINLIPIKRMAEPKEISNYIVNLVFDENSYMTGQTISISGGE